MPAIILLEQPAKTFGQSFDFAGSVVNVVEGNYKILPIDAMLLQVNNRVWTKVVLTRPSLSCVEVNEPRIAAGYQMMQTVRENGSEFIW